MRRFMRSAEMNSGGNWRTPWPVTSANPNSRRASSTACKRPANCWRNISRVSADDRLDGLSPPAITNFSTVLLGNRVVRRLANGHAIIARLPETKPETLSRGVLRLSPLPQRLRATGAQKRSPRLRRMACRALPRHRPRRAALPDRRPSHRHRQNAAREVQNQTPALHGLWPLRCAAAGAFGTLADTAIRAARRGQNHLRARLHRQQRPELRASQSY